MNYVKDLPPKSLFKSLELFIKVGEHFKQF